MKGKKKIASFTGEYKFLSNFYGCFLQWDGRDYLSSEAAYQSAKTTSCEERAKFSTIFSPYEAKQRGRSLPLRADWEDVKIQVMEDVLRCKFSDPELKRMLLATGDAELIEGNHHGDTFWGQVEGVGENILGKLLMKIRDEQQVKSKRLF